MVLAIESVSEIYKDQALEPLFSGPTANSLTQADFGYAVDSLIWDTETLSLRYANFTQNMSDLICLLIEKAKLPPMYLVDTEVLLKDSTQLYYMDEASRKEGEHQ